MSEAPRAAPRSYLQLLASLRLDQAPTLSPNAPSVAQRAEHHDALGPRDFVRSCGEGERNPHLVRLAAGLIGAGCSVRFATQACLGWNSLNDPPLPDGEVREAVARIGRMHAHNHPAVDDRGTPLFELSTASVARFIGKPVPPRDWVLEDCVPMGKTSLLVAPGGTGKSQFVLQLAYDVATGAQYYSPWRPTQPGQVLMICAEDDEDEIHRRFDRLVRLHTADNDEAAQRLRLLGENLFVVPRVGEDNLLTQSGDREVFRTPMVERIAKTIESLPNLRLIILDPVARFRGGDENAAEDTTRFVEAVEALAQRTRAAVLIVHHVNKESMRGADQTQNAARGSSALSNGVRLQINLSPATSKETQELKLPPGKYLVVKITKTNYSGAGEPIYLSRDDEGRLKPVDVDAARGSIEQAAVDRMVEILRSEAAAKRQYSKSSFARAYGGRDNKFGIGEGALKRLVEQAVESGRIAILPGKKQILRVASPIAKAKVTPIMDDGHARS